ncbi:MAG TPA: c-type cytochrome [Lacibacter sp.]|nr:c-type cytochrome [Lacibacter sp.]
MRHSFKIVSAALLCILLINACNQATETKETTTTEAAPSAEDNLKEGERLVASLDCEICHSPKRMGPKGPEVIPELRFGGHQAGTELPPYDEKTVKAGWALFSPDFTTIIGPWGQSYAGNISSDSTGIGMWSEEQFKKVIREGKFKGMDNTRPILPPMPWEAYKNLTDAEISKVFAFLKSTKPVKNVVPTAKINPPPPPAKS